jgi:hypothetical protein
MFVLYIGSKLTNSDNHNNNNDGKKTIKKFFSLVMRLCRLECVG